uniref:Uncharacterized protein n=1 Tax=Strongyloides papillosus TaxID=174720 RepID=A0A0N5BY82_STREA
MKNSAKDKKTQTLKEFQKALLYCSKRYIFTIKIKLVMCLHEKKKKNLNNYKFHCFFVNIIFFIYL